MKYNLDELSSKDPKIKYGASKKIIQRAENRPADLCANLDFFTKLSDNKNHILEWTALDVLGGIGTICSPRDRTTILNILYQKLNCGKMISAGHATKALGRIAKAKIEYQNEIIQELLKVEKYRYDSPECRKIAIGHVIESLCGLPIDASANVKAWLTKQTKNSRPATARKAQKLLGRLGVK